MLGVQMRVLTTMRGFERSWLPGEAVAGLTLWSVLVPVVLAYATLAHVPPVYGIYAAVPALIIYAVVGTSRYLVTGPMAATAALSAATIARLASPSSRQFVALSVGLALVIGAIALAAGILRLGFVASFVSKSVLSGFITGLALTIIVGQIPSLLGLPAGSGGFFAKLGHVVRSVPDAHWWTALVGVVSLALVLALRWLVPRAPGAFIALGLGIVAVAVFGLADKGVAVVGHIPRGLPKLGLPDLGWSDYQSLVGGAAGIALIGFAEGFGAAKKYASGRHETIDANRELLALGLANLGAGLCSGMVVNGTLTKTAVNVQAGARTQLTGLVAAAMSVLTLFFLTGLFADLPYATLAAVVIAAVSDLVDIGSLRRLYAAPSAQLVKLYGLAARAEFFASVAALLGVLVFGVLQGLVIGITASILLIVFRASRPHVAILGLLRSENRWADIERNPTASTAAGVVVARPEGGLFYANADHVRTAVTSRVHDGTTGVVIDAESMPAIDTTGVEMLVDLSRDLAGERVRLLVARPVGQVRDLLVMHGEHAFDGCLFGSVDEAVAAVGTGRASDA